MVLLLVFLILIFIIPSNKKFEFFSQRDWRNNIPNPEEKAGYCAPDFSKFSKEDNVAVRCVGDGKMTFEDCTRLREMGQVCGVNLENWEAYECQYYPGRACKRCLTQNAQY